MKTIRNMARPAAASATARAAGAAGADSTHAWLEQLIADTRSDEPIALVHPCDALALEAAVTIAQLGLARPVLVGPPDGIARAAEAAGVDLRRFEMVAGADAAPLASAQAAVKLVRDGAARALMKGSLHTDELLAAVVARDSGLRTARRISHAFVFDLPRYHKPLMVTDCVVNIAPQLIEKKDILDNAIELAHQLGIARPKVAIVSAVETVNPSISATIDAAALVQMAARHQLAGDALVDGPFGLDNALSRESARIKRIGSEVAGDPDILLVPDLQAGNMLYKSFIYIGGGECAGLVLGAKVPVILTSRADSLKARTASVALAVHATRAQTAAAASATLAH